MPPPERSKFPTSVEDLDWLVTDDGSRTLWDRNLQETYHSGCGAVAESLVVYLANSGVWRRLSEGHATSVFELGLGTGTALLLTAALAEWFGTELRFAAMDIRLLPPDFYRQLDLSHHVDRALQDNAARLAALVPLQPAAVERLPTLTMEFAERMKQADAFDRLGDGSLRFKLGACCSVQIIVDDAVSWQPSAEQSTSFDAVYFDAFSPESSPKLWTAEVFAKMYQLLRGGGTLTSYCVKSSVRKSLQAEGFEVNRLPGPLGGKREVLSAVRST